MTSVPPEHQPDGRGVPRFGSDLAADVAMSPAGDFFFRAGQLLVSADDLERVPGLLDFIRERGRIRQEAGQDVMPIEGFRILDLAGIELRDLRRDRAGTAARVSDRVDDVRTYGVGVGYHLGKDLRWGFNVDRSRRLSDVARRRYSGFKFGTAMTYGL